MRLSSHGRAALQADGHCMYRAVQDQLEAGGSDAAVPGYAELREETASYMRAFPDEFVPFVVQAGLPATSPTGCLRCSELKPQGTLQRRKPLCFCLMLVRAALAESHGIPKTAAGTRWSLGSRAVRFYRRTARRIQKQTPRPGLRPTAGRWRRRPPGEAR